MSPKVISEAHCLVKPNEMPYSVVEMNRFYGCDPALIATGSPIKRLTDWLVRRDVMSEMAKVTRDAGFTLMDKRLIRFGIGEGVTVAQLLAESLSDMHTYPEVRGCAHVWIDYCCFERDNSDLGERWWRGMTTLLKPTHVIEYPTIYVPVHPPDGLMRS